MKPRKLSVLIARFPYGGNGATSQEVPEICDWVTGVVCKAKNDPRISDICSIRISDTPITMTRNQAVAHAQAAGIDVLVMLDSDNVPDLYVGSDPSAQPFFESSFNFLYDNWERGAHVIGTPYCGPPPHAAKGGIENVYVFRWAGRETNGADPLFSIDPYSREEAASMAGIQACAALPTGVIMYDMRAFDLIDKPYFDYEWEGDGIRCAHCNQPQPGPRAKKASTEDVVNTRNISLNGQLKLGYNPVFCNWDSWAGHWKPKCVGKPQVITTDFVCNTLRTAVLVNRRSDERLYQAGAQHRNEIDWLPETPKGFRAMGNNTFREDIEVLEGLVRDEAKRLGRKPVVVEIGTWAGRTAIAMADAGAIVHCVDHWQGTMTDRNGIVAAQQNEDIYEVFLSNLGERYGKTVFAHRMDSLTAAGQWSLLADIIFIDAGHTYDEVKADIEAWAPLVKTGGILCGHDYTEPFPGVRVAADELGIDEVRGTVWIKRMQPQPEHTNGRALATH